ncbi:MAG: ABC transporter substrate-binding protein [Thermomicrobiales bacterium]|nr:ABC transporter substrate-binding protein [Thermomicrobiales bacterium]
MSEKGNLRSLYEQLKTGSIDRRGFMQGATALGVAGGVSMFLANAAAAGPSRNGWAFYSQATEVDANGAPAVGMEGKTRGQDGTIKLLQWQAPTHLMAHRSTGTKDYMAADIINEPLLRYAEDGSLLPNLVTEVPSVENGLLSEDLTTATFKLIEGVVWSDGEPLTANDVVFTWKFITEPSNNSVTSDVWGPIADIVAEDDLTAVVTFASPSAAWFDPFTGGNNGHIYPAHVWGGDHLNEEASTAFQMSPIGTGPFVLESFEPSDHANYVANELYRDPNRPAFARVELKGGGDAPAAARSVLQTGDYDYAWNLQVEPDVIESLISDDGPGQFVVKAGTSLERIHINFSDPNTEVNGQRSEKNTPHPVLTDPAVREAMNMAIDRELIASTLYGPGQPATANILNGLEAFASPNTSWTYDIDAANQILDDAGWVLDGDVRTKDGLKLQFVYQTSVNAVRQKTQSIVKQSFALAGIVVDLEQVDASIFFDSSAGNDQNIGHMYVDINMYTNNSTSAIPIAYMNDWYAGPDGVNIAQKENAWTGGNRQRWVSAEYDAAYEALLVATTLEEAAELLITQNDAVINDRAVIPLVNRAADAYGISKTLYDENVALGAGLEYNYWNIANWNRKAE